jgi:hypothetical protein
MLERLFQFFRNKANVRTEITAGPITFASLACTLALFSWPTFTAAAGSGDYFKIIVMDEQTGRGVPLVEFETVNHIGYWTDSNGIIAFNEPGLMGQEVYVHIRGHGYEYPKDGLGNRGVKLKPTRGGSAR